MPDALNHRLDRVNANLERLTEEVHASQAQTIELARQSARLRRLGMLLVAALVLTIMVGAAGFVANRRTTDDMQTQREEGRQAICDGFESFANSLILASRPSQDVIDAVQVDLDARLAPIGCDLQLIDSPGGP